MTHALLRTALFVPGDRPDRFAKALGCGADTVIVDLEDAVEDARKEEAREHIRAFLEAQPEARIRVRVNGARHPGHAADLVLCAHPGIVGVLLPKAERAEDVLGVATTGKPVWPVVESARGLAAVPEMAAVAGVERLSYGGLDLSADLGLSTGTDAAERILDQVRFVLLLHSRLAGLAAPLESVFPAMDDEPGLERFARNAGAMGFAGILCIHPRQVPVVHAALAPSVEEVAWARRVVNAAARGAGAFKVDGQMVDAPVVERARRVLAAIL